MALRLHRSGGAETAAPGPAGGVGRRGPDGGSAALALAELGNGEGGQEAGGAELRGGCINREGGTCILGWVRGGGARHKESGKFAAPGCPGQGSGCARAGLGALGAPHTKLALSFFFLQARGGGVVGIAPSFSSPQG